MTDTPSRDPLQGLVDPLKVERLARELGVAHATMRDSGKLQAKEAILREASITLRALLADRQRLEEEVCASCAIIATERAEVARLREARERDAKVIEELRAALKPFAAKEVPASYKTAFVSADDLSVARTALEAVEQERERAKVEVATMRLSGGREEYYVRILCGGRSVETRRYGQGYRNRAEYEADMLRHVLLGEPEPDIMDSKYADQDQALTTLAREGQRFDEET